MNIQERRLRLIDFLFEFIGHASRRDIIDHFEVSTATASRDFKLYGERHSRRIDYNVKARRYERANVFEPAYTHDVQDALTFLTTDKWLSPHPNPQLGYGMVSGLPDGMTPKNVAIITRAIACGDLVSAEYAAVSSGSSQRVLAPHLLMNNGMAWYVRCYDRKRHEFRNFRLSRFLELSILEECRKETEGPAEDIEWKNEVVLTLGPHPKHQNKEGYMRDLGLIDKPVLNYRVPSAVAGFVLSAMRVDCSPDASMDQFQFPLRCMNLHELEDVGSMMIAPGR